MTSKDTRPAPRAVSPSSARDDSARVGVPDVSQRPSCGLRVAFRVRRRAAGRWDAMV